MKHVFGTSELARLFHVAPRTVAKWIDTGLLRGYRVPGSRVRRVARGEAIAFAVRHHVPVEELGIVCSEFQPPDEPDPPPPCGPPDGPPPGAAAALGADEFARAA